MWEEQVPTPQHLNSKIFSTMLWFPQTNVSLALVPGPIVGEVSWKPKSKDTIVLSQLDSVDDKVAEREAQNNWKSEILRY